MIRRPIEPMVKALVLCSAVLVSGVSSALGDASGSNPPALHAGEPAHKRLAQAGDSRAAPPSDEASSKAFAELMWTILKDSRSPDDLRGYIADFPDSPHVEAAKARLERLLSGEDAADPDRVSLAELKRQEQAFGQAKKARLQRALQAQGFYDMEIDGRLGPGSRRAITAYQEASGATGTGYLTPRQAAALIAVAARDEEDDEAAWKAARRSSDVADLQDYLRRFGARGRYRAQAKTRIVALMSPPPAPKAETPPPRQSAPKPTPPAAEEGPAEATPDQVIDAAQAIVEAQRKFEKFFKDANDVSGDRSVPLGERLRKFRGMLGQVVDFEPMARFVLGRHKETMTEAQWVAFLRQYKELFLSGYEIGMADTWTGEFTTREIREWGDDYLLRLSLLRKDGSRQALDFRLRWKPESLFGFKIVNARLEGVSLLEVQRSEFHAVLKSSGIDGLTRTLEQKYGKAPQPIEIPD